jgi:hypothetical protein
MITTSELGNSGIKSPCLPNFTKIYIIGLYWRMCFNGILFLNEKKCYTHEMKCLAKFDDHNNLEILELPMTN